MKGHFVFTRSWYDHGNKQTAPGSFISEITPGLFGGRQNEAEQRIDQRIRHVPESLAPANSGLSVMLLFHPYSDSTVVTRSWYVSDRLTGDVRGVPYSNGIAFTEEDNRRFLVYPGSAFERDAHEPYDSYANRESGGALFSAAYDPDMSKYRHAAASLGRNAWKSEFGFDKEAFKLFYAALYSAVSAPDSHKPEKKKIAVVLPAGSGAEAQSAARDMAERLIMRSLLLLPNWLRVRFCACSLWKDALDADASAMLDGFHMVCYQNEAPASQAPYPVIDLTKAKRHRNASTVFSTGLHEKDYLSEYADWVWDTFDEPQGLADFQSFLAGEFKSAVTRLQASAIAVCHYMWLRRDQYSSGLSARFASESIVAVVGAFAERSFDTAFLVDALKASVETCIAGVHQGECSAKLAEAAAKLADLEDQKFPGSNITRAAELSKAICSKYSGGSANWEIAAFGVPRLIRDIQGGDYNHLMTVCNYVRSQHARYSREAFDTLRSTASKLRAASLSGDGKMFILYKSATSVLSSMAKIPTRFFTIPADADMESFKKVTAFDISSLAFVPDADMWKEFFVLVTKKRADILNIRETVFAVAGMWWDAVKAMGAGAVNELVGELIGEAGADCLKFFLNSDKIHGDVRRILAEFLQTEQVAFDASLESSWQQALDWMIKLKRLGMAGDGGVRESLRMRFPVNSHAVRTAVETFAVPTLVTVSELINSAYSDAPENGQWHEQLKEAEMVDDAVASGRSLAELIENSQYKSETAKVALSDRIVYWVYKDDIEAHPERAVTAGVALAFMKGESNYFDSRGYLELIRITKGLPEFKGAGGYDSGDVTWLMRAIRLSDRSQDFRFNTRQGISAAVQSALREALAQPNAVELFAHEDVCGEFKALLRQSATFQAHIGNYIYGRLTDNAHAMPENEELSQRIASVYHYRSPEPEKIAETGYAADSGVGGVPARLIYLAGAMLGLAVVLAAIGMRLTNSLAVRPLIARLGYTAALAAPLTGTLVIVVLSAISAACILSLWRKGR